MYHNITVEEVIADLYKRWSPDGENDCLLAATSLLERVRAAVGDDVVVADAISTMNDIAHARQLEKK